MPSLAIDTRRMGEDIALDLDPDNGLRVTPTGDLQTVAGRANLRAALRRRVCTSPGELLHRPEYGAGAPDFIETIGNPSNRARLANQVRKNLLRDRRLADVAVGVSAGLPSDSRAAAVTVELTITPRRDSEAERLTVSLLE
jgi:hypothetical protein